MFACLQEGMQRACIKPLPEDLQRFKQVSPVAHIDNMQAPMLFCLGAKDRRVPLQDAQQFVAALRARQGAPETEVYVFPEDTHALDKPQTEYEQLMVAAQWFKQHMQGE